MMGSGGVGASGASMMGPGYQQTGGYQGPGMMSMRQPQQSYMSQTMSQSMSQGQMVQRPPQYMQVMWHTGVRVGGSLKPG